VSKSTNVRLGGSRTEKPKSPSTWSGQAVFPFFDARSTRVSAIKTMAGMANRNARLRPSVARRVIAAIVGLKYADMSVQFPWLEIR